MAENTIVEDIDVINDQKTKSLTKILLFGPKNVRCSKSFVRKLFLNYLMGSYGSKILQKKGINTIGLSKKLMKNPRKNEEKTGTKLWKTEVEGLD